MTQEEIESLGWIHDDCEPNNYVKGECHLCHNPITNHIKIDDADRCFIAFEGVVDDISTLKKITANLLVFLWLCPSHEHQQITPTKHNN